MFFEFFFNASLHDSSYVVIPSFVDFFHTCYDDVGKANGAELGYTLGLTKWRCGDSGAAEGWDQVMVIGRVCGMRGVRQLNTEN